MRIAATTVIRHVPHDGHSGRLLLLRLDPLGQVTVEDDHRLPENRFRAADPNPRGGTRGLRGVAPMGDGLVVSDYSTVYRLDAAGHVVAALEHPWASGNHGVVPDDDGVWLASTNADAVVRLRWDGSVVTAWRPFEALAAAGLPAIVPDPPKVIGDYRDPAALSAHRHDTVHLNSVSVDRRGLTVSLGLILTPSPGRPDARVHASAQPGGFRERSWRLPAGEWSAAHAVLRQPLNPAGLPAGEAEVLWHGPAGARPRHDIAECDGLLWFNDSDDSAVVGVHAGTVRCRIRVPGDFLRGMAAVSDHQVLVGTQSPLAVHLVDLPARRVRASTVLPGRAGESATCLAALGARP